MKRKSWHNFLKIYKTSKKRIQRKYNKIKISKKKKLVNWYTRKQKISIVNLASRNLVNIN